MAGPLKPQIFNCVSCGSPLEVTAIGYSTTVICKKCNSTIDISHPLPKLIQRYNDLIVYKPTLAIGSFGKLQGLKWKIIGFVVREDIEYSAQWKEYLLYNPYYGFRFLLELDSHFSLIETMNFNPFPNDILTATQLHIDKVGDFYLYNRGKAKVIFALGEFYWKVKVGDTVSMSELICPPYMLSVEKDSEELNFSMGVYLSTSEVAAGFNTELEIPWKISANQPNPYSAHFKGIMKIYWGALCALVLFAFFLSISKPQKLVSTFNLSNSDFSNAQKEFVSPAFELPDSFGNIQLDLSAQVNNTWLSTDVVLVNEDSGEEYNAETGVEYYSGYDGEYWSEGSQKNIETISSIPGGRYHAEVSAETDMPVKNFQLDIRRNGSMAINFFVTFFLISIYPLWVIARRRSFEVSRWSESDFSMYHGAGSLNGLTETIMNSIGDDD